MSTVPYESGHKTITPPGEKEGQRRPTETSTRVTLSSSSKLDTRMTPVHDPPRAIAPADTNEEEERTAKTGTDGRALSNTESDQQRTLAAQPWTKLTRTAGGTTGQRHSLSEGQHHTGGGGLPRWMITATLTTQMRRGGTMAPLTPEIWSRALLTALSGHHK